MGAAHALRAEVAHAHGADLARRHQVCHGVHLGLGGREADRLVHHVQADGVAVEAAQALVDGAGDIAGRARERPPLGRHQYLAIRFAGSFEGSGQRGLRDAQPVQLSRVEPVDAALQRRLDGGVLDLLGDFGEGQPEQAAPAAEFHHAQADGADLQGGGAEGAERQGGGGGSGHGASFVGEISGDYTLRGAFQAESDGGERRAGLQAILEGYGEELFYRRERRERGEIFQRMFMGGDGQRQGKIGRCGCKKESKRLEQTRRVAGQAA